MATNEVMPQQSSSPAPMLKAAEILPVSAWMVDSYWALFVGRLEYNVQSFKSNEKGKHYYYKATDRETKATLQLSKADVQAHLAGRKTLGLFAIDPATNCCKWFAIDGDYDNAWEDLQRLRADLLEDGIHAALERSRRGGHLWVFAETPIPAALCRKLIFNLAFRLRIPIKGVNGQAEGIEVFPRQDAIEAADFGNALRGPLGIHRKTGERYWFAGAKPYLRDQIQYLRGLPRVSPEALEELTVGMRPASDFTMTEARQAFVAPTFQGPSRAFRITDHVALRRPVGKNYEAQCPSCAKAGRDKGRDNLHILVSNPMVYVCRAGCHKDDIRAALGYGPSRKPLQ